MSFFDDVEEFHKAFKINANERPEFPDIAEQDLRMKLIREEVAELELAHRWENFVEVADALADIIYVACGMAVSYGIPLNEVWEEVHRSNMAKLDPVLHAPIYREDGKVMKPPGWTKPDIEGVLNG
jgi:predicted HAD superfamily Cof-like phosphohydrolase